MSPDVSPPIFDLTREPWLLVRFDDGVREVSLREAFAQAHDIRSIVGELPTQSFALVRLLLAILHSAVRPIIDSGGITPVKLWSRLWSNAEPLNEATDGYLDRWQHRFDLLHPSEPFYQVAGLHTRANRVYPVETIILDVPPGHKFFALRSGAGLDTLTFAEAARWLVHEHAYGLSGLKSAAIGDDRKINPNGTLPPQGTAWAGTMSGLIIEGRSLRETLLLNLVLGDPSTGAPFASPEDKPIWEQPSLPGPATRRDNEGVKRTPRGPIDMLTWQSRRVLLNSDLQRISGVIVTYGDRAPTIDAFSNEHMCSWKRSAFEEKRMGRDRVYVPLRHDREKTVWENLAALLPHHDEQSKEARTLILDPPIGVELSAAR